MGSQIFSENFWPIKYHQVMNETTAMITSLSCGMLEVWLNAAMEELIQFDLDEYEIWV